MNFSTDTLEERRLFTYEERKAALKRSNGICACCGKKLSTKTMTMDHIIPISRGGTNEAENLVALCPECNKKKGSILYLPRGYYKAVKSESELNAMENHVEKWFQSIKDQFLIEKFPLIAPATYVQINPVVNSHKKKNVYIPTMMLKWQIINIDYYAEIEAVTGIDIREIRKNLHTINPSIKLGDEIPTVALYSLRKVTSDKILAVMAVEVLLEENHLNIWMPWSELPKKYLGSVLFNFVSILLDSIIRIGEYKIDTYAVISTIDYEKTVEDFVKIAINYPNIGWTYDYHSGINLRTNSFMEKLIVTRYGEVSGKIRECVPKAEGED